MVALCIGSFTNAIVILNSAANAKIRQGGGDEPLHPLVSKKFGHESLDAFMQQYELGLGEFEDFTGSFENSTQKDMLWIYFFMATFLTQIIFMNNLIAILGDTYNSIMDHKQKFALKTRA